jgi:hypothetical protein
MFTYLRYTLLMPAVLLGTMIPPSRPPGRRPAQAPSAAASAPARGPCPYPDCQGEGSRRKELVYLCRECNREFYYCTDCKVFYTPGKEDHDKHKPSVVR